MEYPLWRCDSSYYSRVCASEPVPASGSGLSASDGRFLSYHPARPFVSGFVPFKCMMLGKESFPLLSALTSPNFCTVGKCVLLCSHPNLPEELLCVKSLSHSETRSLGCL